MIAVFVRHKDNPAFRGTTFARDWTELFKINNLYRHWQAIP